jgi:MFS family permease
MPPLERCRPPSVVPMLLSALRGAARLGSLLEVVRAPHVAGVASASLVARLPRGMAMLAVVLFEHDQTCSFAVAGAAAAALSLGDAAASPVQGRLIDRLGHQHVLVPSAVVYSLGLTALATSPRDLPPAAATLLAGVSGAAWPPISASMKAFWPALVPGDRLVLPSYALESLIQQSVFLIGPVLVTALLAVGSFRLAIVGTAALALAGTAPFVATGAARGSPMPTGARRRSGPLRAAGVRALVAVAFLQSVALGLRAVAVPAFADDRGHPNAAGIVLAVLNVGALAGVLVAVAARSRNETPAGCFCRNSTLLAIAAAPLPCARTLEQLAGLLVFAGLFIAPTAAASYVLIDRVSPARCRTEAFAWLSTAVAAGAALGSAAGGVVTDHLGVPAALGCGFVCVAVAALAPVAAKPSLQWASRVSPAPSAAATARDADDPCLTIGDGLP